MSEYYVLLPDDTEGTLVVNTTDEGLILDLFERGSDGQPVATFGRTAQELVDTLFGVA